jgi:hypothetical protein
VQRLRRLGHRVVPAHFEDPVGLALRLLRSGSPQARSAMMLAALGVLTAPVDLVLSPVEQRRYRRARPPQGALVFVCGPPRSGTTLVAQTLIRCLPVTYLNNLTALFPRAPITANRLARTPLCNQRVSLTSHYGKTVGLGGPNDGLHLWDRWLGADRRVVSDRLDGKAADGLVRFFGAWEHAIGGPVVAKNNNLNAWASVVAGVLPTAHFVCLSRDPLYLAQSLLVARRYIHGNLTTSYGIPAPDGDQQDPIDDVCRQVAFHTVMAERQRQAIGDERFWLISYEDFCARPERLVRRVAEQILGVDVDEAALRQVRLTPSTRQVLEPTEFARLEATLARRPRTSSA